MKRVLFLSKKKSHLPAVVENLFISSEFTNILKNCTALVITTNCDKLSQKNIISLGSATEH